MLSTLFIVLLVLWLLGVVTSYTLGGLMGIGAIVAVGIGIMLSVSFGKPTVTEEFQP